MDASATVLIISTAIQQAVELIDTIFPITRSKATPPGEPANLSASTKRALAFGFAVLAVLACFKTLPPLGVNDFLGGLIWAIALSAGTDGVNSLLKYLTYVKENKKVDAAKTLQSTNAIALRTVESGAMASFRTVFPAARPQSVEDRVVAVVERWSGTTVFDTRTSLETHWLGGPHSSLDLNPAGLQILCADLSTEFRGELDLSDLAPASFKTGGGTIDTVDDLIEEVGHAPSV